MKNQIEIGDYDIFFSFKLKVNNVVCYTVKKFNANKKKMFAIDGGYYDAQKI